jgi:hypothetical protein
MLRKRKIGKKKLLLASGFTQTEVYASSNFCDNLEVLLPPKHL